MDITFPILESLLRLSMLVVGYIPSHTIRMLFYRHIFKASIGKKTVIYYGAEIRAPWSLYIGESCIIGDKSILDARHGIFIGNNVNFSTGVWIWTLQHDVNSETFSSTGEGKTVIIADRAWLSSRTVILPGVNIGEGAVAAAGAVVTKDLEPFTIYGGVPARAIGKRNMNLTYVFSGRHVHFL